MWLSPLALVRGPEGLSGSSRMIVMPRNAEIAESQTTTGGTFNVKAFGAVGDGSNDDTEAIQTALDAAPDGSVVVFDDGSYKTTSQLNVSNSITIQGSGQYTCEILAVGASGIKINKQSNFHMFDMDVAAASRHTVSPNAFIGIEVDPPTTSTAMCTWMVLKRRFVPIICGRPYSTTFDPASAL